MKNILVICPGEEDQQELAQQQVNAGYNVIFHQYDGDALRNIIARGEKPSILDPAIIIDNILHLCDKHSIDGVISTGDYPGSIFASIIAHETGLIGPSPQTLLLCQHKYYARCAQQDCVASVIPNFALIDPNNSNHSDVELAFPIFIKPVKSVHSIGAYQVNSPQELDYCIKRAMLPDMFLYQFNWFLQHYSSYTLDARYLLVEDLLEGVQTTLEGYVYQGEIEVLGIVDSIMFPGTISFERFEYPSSLPHCIQKRMIAITKKFIANIGLNNTMFNIEFMYNHRTNEIHIIEINPRMVCQFADLFEKVDGTNTYAVLLALAAGKRPVFTQKKGKHAFAASCVLRIFEDKKVLKVPSSQQIAELTEQFPDIRIRIRATEGQKLSYDLQDGRSFRYGLVHLGGSDREDTRKKFEHIKAQLNFIFEPIE